MKRAPSRSAGSPRKQRTKRLAKEEESQEKKVLPITEKEDGTLIIGDGEYSIDKYDELQIPRGKPYPRIRVAELIDVLEYFNFEGADGTMFNVSFQYEGYTTIGFEFSEGSSGWSGQIGLYTYIELLEACIKRHPEYANLIEFSRKYIGSADAHFGFAVDVSDDFLDDAITNGLALIAEILQPITDIKELIDQTVAVGKLPTVAQKHL